MSLFLGFLTFVLVVTCLLLILLILIQLPKKEAGAGVAFGGGATDALFGAGSGNALTKMTKYTATFFVGMALTLSCLNSSRAKEGDRRLEQELRKKASLPAARVPAAATNSPLSVTTTPAVQIAPVIEATNTLGTAISNSAATNITVSRAVPAQATTNSAPPTTAAPAGPAPTPANAPAVPPK